MKKLIVSMLICAVTISASNAVPCCNYTPCPSDCGNRYQPVQSNSDNTVAIVIGVIAVVAVGALVIAAANKHDGGRSGAGNEYTSRSGMTLARF